MPLLAQIDEKTLPTIFPPARFVNISNLTGILIPALFLGAILLFLVILIFGAYKVITAEGDPEKMKSAKQLFKYSVLGMIVVLAAYFAVKLITFILEVPFLL